MKKISTVAFLLSVLLLLHAVAIKVSAMEQAAGDNQKKEERIEKPGEILTHLSNGLLVYIIQDKRFPLVCSRLYVRTGSAMEDPAQAGISHVLEHMVFKGTSHRPKGEVARDVESLGGYLNAATSFDKTWYLTDMPAAHWAMGMDVLKDMAFQATLDPAELESEKNVVISELQRGEDSPMRRLFESLQVAALKNTPYGRPIIGFEETIRKLTVADLHAYVNKWYQPQNMMLLVCGDIDPDQVLNHARELFGNLENTSDLAVATPYNVLDAANGSEKIKVERGPWSKIYLGISMPAPALANLQSIELDVLCYLLGGDGTSLFYQKYKYDQQLVDSISVSNMSLDKAGMLSITATLDTDKLERFWQELTSDLGKLSASSFDQASIARARFNLEDGMDRAGETLNGLASWKAAVQFDFGGQLGEENIRFTQRNVDRIQLGNAIKEWLDPKRARVRVLASADAKIPDLAAIMDKNWQVAKNAPKKLAQGGKPETEVLDIGDNCKLILMPDDTAPYMAMDFVMTGGNAILKPEQQGLASLSARLVTDGCGSMGKPVLERWLSERAASLGASAGLQTFSITLDGPSRFASDFFGLLLDILRKPKFDSADFQREINNMKSALIQRNDQPLSFMFAKVNPFLFPDGQVYGYDRLGDAKTLESFTVMDVRDFWSKQSGQPWVLSVSGSFNRDDVEKFARNLPAPRGKRIALETPVWNASQKNLDLTLPGKNQSHLLRIFPTVPLTSPDAPALMLLESILSGQSGMLFTLLRDEQGLGYTVTAFNRSMPKTGFMAFYIGTTPDKMEQARAGFDEVIVKLKKEPLANDLLRAGANQLLGEYLRSRQSLSSRANGAATDAILDYPLDFQRALIDKAASLEPEELQKVAKKYLHNPYDVVLMP